ncbi:MAG: LLM class flavin-dependent oxidoreductase [Rhodospirillaceae bacterium]|nr:LLM class flavin-dependent oxidoreductase [Rhodospirillaceae bacterium]|tara:strand:+ start:199 stop:1485 length:1287 start_codon:yes stop_codon:yes gene_type:complete
MPERTMRLNFHGNYAGSHPQAWKAGTNTPGELDLDFYVKYAQIAERGLFDGIFYAADLAAQGPNRKTCPGLDPVVLSAALATNTEHIGLAATISTTFSEPYNVAKSMATLDHISGGRAAWNIVTSYDPMAAPNFGMTELPPKEERYDRAKEFVEIVLSLWDSWDTDAIDSGNGNGGTFVDSAIHPIDHTGRYYSVRGPAQTPRSPQRRPVLFQAGASEEGKSFAAQVADGIFCVALDLSVAKEFYAEMKTRVKKANRNPDDAYILPGIYMYLGSTEEEAKRALEEQADPAEAMKHLAVKLSTSEESLNLDETVPDEILEQALINAQSDGHTRSLVEFLQSERLTVREFLERQPLRGPHRVLVGVPETIAGWLETWFVEKAADGFNIGNLTHETLTIFVDEVVPRLQARGLFRHEYQGKTLRENFCGSA